MQAPKITIIVPTYNRPKLLELSLRSILAQDYDDFGVIVLDNHSTDETPRLVQSLMERDRRVRLVRQSQNIGILRNWNSTFSLNPSPYLSIFHDDDIMLPGFVRETVAALEANPTAGFVLVQVQYIDPTGEVTGVQDVGDLPDGLMSGLDLLELAVDGRHQGIFPPNIVMRASAVDPGLFESPHTICQFDLNLYNRMAARHDVFFIRKPLAQYRRHAVTETARLKQESTATTWYGEIAERIDAIATLLRSGRAADPKYRQWLADRLLYLHAHQSAAIHPSIPMMYHDWDLRVFLASETIEKHVPTGESFILIDDSQLGLGNTFRGRRVLPMIERDGQYWGPPADDSEAIRQLDRLVDSGIKWLVFGWPSYWWLDQYWQFRIHVERRFALRANTPHVLVYQLQT
ncbi:MAG: glycosyltransferase family 2 protein [Tepidisphaeraceae bacterium]